MTNCLFLLSYITYSKADFYDASHYEATVATNLPLTPLSVIFTNGTNF